MTWTMPLTLMSEDDSGETASDRKKRRRLLHSYEEGRIHALLRRVERKTYYKNLPKAIDRYKPKDYGTNSHCSLS